MRVYLKNTLAESEELGAWFTIPINLIAVKYMLGKGSYEVVNTELPFFLEKGVYDLEKLNQACKEIETMSDFFPLEDVEEIQKKWFSSIFDLLNHVEELKFWPNCSSMLQVVERMMEIPGPGNDLGNMPQELKQYIDVKKYAEHLESTRDFLVTGRSVFERRK